MTPGNPAFELEGLEAGVEFYMLVRASLGLHSRHVRVRIDEQTHSSINDVLANATTGDRHRLSLQCTWDPFGECNISSITRVNSVSRQSIPFACTAAYKQTVDDLRSVRDLRQLEGTPCASEEVPVREPTGHRALRIGQAILLCILIVSVLSVRMKPPEAIEANGYPGTGEYDIRESRPVSLDLYEVAIAPQARYSDENPGNAERVAENPGNEERVAENPGNEERGGEEDPGNEDPDVRSLLLQPGDVVGTVPRGYVALTFDDGPSVHTRAIVDILEEQGVAATFFFIGEHLLAYPGAVEYAHSRGMALGNHSWSHRSLVRGDPCFRTEIVETSNLLSSMTNSPVMLFRPPFGLLNNELKAFLANEDMKTVLWDRDPEDWRAVGAQDIVDYVVEADPPGGIFLLHETRHTVEALVTIIHYLKEQDLKFVIFE